MPGKRRAHYGGTYAIRSKQVRDAAYADPATRCWRCGLTLAEIQRAKPHATWDAGHVNDGQVNGVLLPECSPCNRSSGAAMGNAKREPRSRRWS
jgi:hypothetical protein